MLESEQEPSMSILQRIEASDSPVEAVGALGSLSLRSVVATPINIGRDILKIVINGDAGEMARDIRLF